MNNDESFMKTKQRVLAIIVMGLVGYFFIYRAESAEYMDTTLQKWHHMDETDPLGIAHVPGYISRGFNGKHFWNTNMTENWWGIWIENTNTGWRVNLCPVRSNAVDTAVIIKVGSIVTDSGAGLMGTPDGKYAKLELLDANGKVVQTRKSAAEKLYEAKYAVTDEAEKELVNKHPVSPDDASVEENYPDTISDLEYTRWKNGSFLHFVGFVSNGPPCHIGYINFNDIFSVKTEGDYTLMVQPVVYRMHYDGGTFQGYLDRVDLPSVSAKIHLLPSQ
jgi:hypothetical protein